MANLQHTAWRDLQRPTFLENNIAENRQDCCNSHEVRAPGILVLHLGTSIDVYSVDINSWLQPTLQNATRLSCMSRALEVTSRSPPKEANAPSTTSKTKQTMAFAKPNYKDNIPHTNAPRFQHPYALQPSGGMVNQLGPWTTKAPLLSPSFY